MDEDTGTTPGGHATAGRPSDPQDGDVWCLPGPQAPQAFLYWPDPTGDDSADPCPWMRIWPPPASRGDERYRWFRTRELPDGLVPLLRGGREPDRPYRIDDVVRGEPDDGRRWTVDVDEWSWDDDPDAFRQVEPVDAPGGWVRFADLPPVVLVERAGRAVAR